MRGNVAQDCGQAIACCFEHGDWLTFVARWQYKDTSVSIKLRQRVSGLPPQHDHARRIFGGLGYRARMRSEMIRLTNQRKLKLRRINAAVCVYQIKLALCFINARNNEGISLR